MLDVDRVVLNFQKDLTAAKNWFILLIVFGFMLMMVSWIAMAGSSEPLVRQSDIPWMIVGAHAYIAIICSVSFLAGANIAYYSEIQGKTLKTMSLYDLSLNDISIMKIFSASGLGVMFAYIFVNITFLPFMWLGGFHAFRMVQAVLFATCFCFILLTVAAVYLMHLIVAFAPLVNFRPAALHAFLMYLSFFMTETFFRMVAGWSDLHFSSTSPPLWAFGMYLSPVHLSGRMAGAMLGITSMDATAAVIPLVLIAIFVFGFFGTEEKRLEIFLR